MKFSTQGRYGLKIMHYLAQNECGKPISLATISEDLDLSRNYLEQLVQYLRQENLITSTRGAYGGYQLAKPSEKITIGEILRAMNELTITDCAENPDSCLDHEICKSHRIWCQIQEAIHEEVDKIYLSDMLESEDIEEEV